MMFVCKSSLDYDELFEKLGIRGKVCKVTNKRTIKARAIWYHEFRNKLWGKKEEKKEETEGGSEE